jgi:CHAT domain-containing protein
MKFSFNRHCIAGLASALLALQAAAQVPSFAPAARASGRMSMATDVDAFSRDVQSVVAMSGNGKTLYDADTKQLSWGAYCGSSRTSSDRGEFRKAVREASKALHLGGAGADPVASAFATRDLAIAYSWAGDFDNAKLWADRSLGYAKNINSINFDVNYSIRFDVIKTLADIAFQRGQYEQALTLYKEADTKLPWVGAGFNKDFLKLSIANTQSKLGLAEAQTTLAELSKGGDINIRMLALRTLASSELAAQKIDQALVSAQTLNTLSQESKNAYYSLWAQHLTAQIFQQAGKKDAAIEAALLAVDSVGKVNAGFKSVEMKSSLFGNVQDVYEQAVLLLVQSGRWEEAFNVSERSRARTTLELMRKVQEAGNTTRPRALKAADIQKRLPEKTSLISYFVLPTAVVVWQIDASQVKGFKVDLSKDQLAKDVTSFRSAIEQEDTSTVNKLASSLYAQLAMPLALDKDQSLILAPHSFLHFLPFQALKNNQKWWIEQHPISYAISGSALPEQGGASDMAAALQNVMALGNPDVNNTKLDLPGASLEVESIKALYPSAQTFTRKEASKVKVMSDGASASVLHIAAHALVDELDPIHSYVLLSNPVALSGSAGGELEAKDFQQLKLSKTSLVTLSACNSGIGKIAKGDDFSGFKSAILLAGASRLLVSLWPVDDDATAALMSGFYKSAATMKPAAAMRKAQLELIAKSDMSSPFKWAPFVLVGDPR